jgi:hypothetical protein
MKAHISMSRSVRRLSPEARRMLGMLTAWPEGVLEPVLRAHGFQPKLVVALVRAGLVTGNLEYTPVGGRETPTMRMKITLAGRLARQPAAKTKRA